ncbi:hypothetical protein AWH56_008735 [Anaerobacillus isosaccharinicus]|uniref:Uncharacterized protein n=1 Tax=Anaerobacillus isosaccharinicus TaxID=1532552 RepID=A0A1S2L3G0_9BACI|nr:hypothetical protein [Anaerobacillus isosaccharinicus]MBA5588941.1 hypothetical protein [Anaerobacillus isosaccharinicus]QOY37650.1 hypothetical protein AWH56_008735 [Anaerobacillus isosaccharinicus]
MRSIIQTTSFEKTETAEKPKYLSHFLAIGIALTIVASVLILSQFTVGKNNFAPGIDNVDKININLTV